MSEEKVNLTYIARALFTERVKFRDLTEEEKGKWGFIVNRMMSRKYPEFAQKMNVRSGDFSIVLNLWWGFLKDKEKDYRWFWSRAKVNKSKLSKSVLDMVRLRYPHLSDEDIEYLSEHFPDVFSDNIKYYEKLIKDYGTD